MSSDNSINLYGAVTKIPSGSRDFNFKQNIRQTAERLLFRFQNSHKIDYRNYVNSGTYNLGDHAIAIAVNQQIKACTQNVKINLTDWNSLDAIEAEVPVLFSGSGYYFIESSKNLSSRILRDSQIIHRNRISCAYFGVGVNYVGEDQNLSLDDISMQDREILASSLSTAKMISVRDATSQALLQPLTDKPISVTGDPALFIKSCSVNPRTHGQAKGPPIIGINIPFHGPAASARISNDLEAYIQFLKVLQKETGCHFIQTVHFHSSVLIGKIMQDSGIRLTQAVGNVQTLLDAYQKMDFHIGGMLHSCILSASVGTPCIGLAYDIKHQGFFDLIGQPDLCIPAEPFDPERLMVTCKRVMDTTNAIRTQINKRRDELEAESGRFLTQTMRALLT